jgi:hypothetical protein
MGVQSLRGAGRRRKLLWLGGLGAALGLVRSTPRVEAGNGDPLLLGQTNTATAVTELDVTTGPNNGTPGFLVKQLGASEPAVGGVGGPSIDHPLHTGWLLLV